jgi:hypothetical protein
MANLCPAKRVNALPERGKFHHVSFSYPIFILRLSKASPSKQNRSF